MCASRLFFRLFVVLDACFDMGISSLCFVVDFVVCVWISLAFLDYCLLLVCFDWCFCLLGC